MSFQLIQSIIEMSIAKNWDEAKLEWQTVNSYMNEDYETCLCGHYPIKEIIILENVHNGNQTKVGNCCINKFFEIKDFNKFFKALSQKRINAMVIKVSYDKLIINEKEKDFLMNVWRKKRLSPKQLNWLDILKRKIFQNLSRGDNGTSTTIQK